MEIMKNAAIIVLLIITYSKATNDVIVKFLGVTNAYRSVDGIWMDKFDDYEGIIDLPSCITICGCKGNGVAAFDKNTSSCYCGEIPQDNCDSDSCISVYDSSGISISFYTEPPSKVYVNVPLDIAATPSNVIRTFGLLINNRLSIYPTNLMPSVVFGMPGSYSIVVEANNYFGCPSTKYEVIAEIKDISCYFNALPQFKSQVNVTFNMFLNLNGPDNLRLLKIKLFKDSASTPFEESSYTNPSASIYLEIGGNSETNRYQTYNLTFSENKRTAVIVSLNHQISSSGKITGFSAHITKLGGIRFLILEPACEKTTSGSVRKTCYLSKKCVASSDTCPQYFNTFYPSAATDIFYPDWIQFGPSNTNLPTNLVPRAASDIMFRVVYSFSVNATVLGHNDFGVPDSERFLTTPGQFLAWMPDFSNNIPGDIAYNSIDSASQFQSIHYDEIFDAFFNEIFDDNSAYLSPIIISDTEHMISLYLEIPSKYLVEVSANYPDGTEIVAEAFVTNSNGVEEKLCEGSTFLVSDIQSLALSTSDLSVYALIYADITFIVNGASATANYAVYWDEDIVRKAEVYDEIFNTTKFTHNFSTPGSYNVTVKAFTDLSFKITYLPVYIVCELEMPSFFNTNEDPIRASEIINPVKTTDEEISVDVAFTGCGMITINYYLESDILKTNGSSFLWLANSSIFVIRSNEFQTQAQNINITVCATNNIEVQCINDIGYVEDVIENFNLIATTMETNVMGFLQISSSTKGTNKTYCIEWGDGNSTCTNGTYNVEFIEHTYGKPGNYTIFALAFNRVSRMNSTVLQEVQDRISGCKISTQPTVYKRPTEILFSIGSGFGIVIVVDWGDNKTKSVINDVDIFFNKSSISLPNSFVDFRGFASFTFSVKQDYNICLSLTNDVSNDSCCVVAIVEDQILDFNINLIQEFEGTNKTDWIEENETLSLISDHFIEAKRVLYLVSLGNKTVFNTTSPIVNLSYTPWKLCYNYSVVATNPVSIASDWMNLCVQRPLYPINSTGFVHAPENSTEEMSIKFTFSVGNYFNCYFNFSDESENSIFPVSYTDFVGPIGFIETKHKFKAGEYNVTLSCTNRLYDFFSSTVVLSQNPINKPYLNIRALCYNDSIVSEVELTKDSPEIMSAACNIFVKLEDQLGSSVMEIASLGIDGKKKGPFFVYNSSIEFKSMLWSSTSVNNAEICINSTNKVSADLTCKTIKLVAPVLAVKLTVVGQRHSAGVPIKFIIDFPTPVPGSPCLEVDFGEGAIPQLYGGANCNGAVNVLLVPFIQFYTYKKIGSYYVTATGSNQVSSKTQTAFISVLVACTGPSIEIVSSTANSESAIDKRAWFYKCKNTTFMHVMKTNCSRPNSTLTKRITIEYKIDNVTWVKYVDENLDIAYVLNGKSLKYGVYRVTFIGQMVDSFTLDPIDGAVTKKMGYFKIVPCSLRIVVDGGYEKTFQRGGEIIINATKSYDPDDDNAAFKAEWFCGRSGAFNELNISDIKEKLSYPVVDTATYDDSSFPSKGCFSNSKNSKAALLNDKGLMSLKLVLISDYLWYYCYDLRLKITKMNDEQPNRQAVKDVTICIKKEVPLQVSVKCEQNCDDLVNPNTKLSISSFVLNKANCSQIIYKWQAFRKLHANKSSIYENITEELLAGNKSITGFDLRNFVLAPKSLSSTYTYKFRVNATCAYGKLKGASGAAAEIKAINSPPDVSKATCVVTPTSGIAFQTTFVIACEGVSDEQTPLTYGFEYNCNDTWALLTISISAFNITSGPFKLPPSNKKSGYCSLRVRARDSYGVQSDPIPTSLEVEVSTEKREKRSIGDLTSVMCKNLSTEYILSSQFLTANYIAILLGMKSSISNECKSTIENLLVSIWVDTLESAEFVVRNIQTDRNHTIALAALQNVVNIIFSLSATELSMMSVLISSKTSLLGGGKGLEGQRSMELSLSFESQVFSLVATTLIVGEPAAKSETPLGSISIVQIESGPQTIEGFILPDIGGDGGGAISSVGANRYKFDKTSASVKGDVKGMSLTNPDGSPKPVKNLTNLIKLTLENKEEAPPMKNFTAYCELMRDIHRVDATVNSSIIVLNIKPVDNIFNGSFFIFMNKGTAPSLTDNQQNCTLPNPQPDNWSNMSLAEQEYWKKEKEWICYFSEVELNRTAIGVWCVGVIYYNNTHPLTKELLPLSAAPSDDNCTAVRYYFQAYTRACLYWDKDINTWNSDGCETIEEETNSYQTVCGCSHLTDFGGGGPFATAEPLDLGALKRFNLKSNPTVFSVVVALFGVYFILLVWARKKDISNFEKKTLIILPENHYDDKYFYEIVVETGFEQGCSTTADVMIVITGSNGESGPRRLYSPARKCFQRAETDFFLMAVPYGLGELSGVTIWHNNTGASPGWFLLKIQVRDLQTQKQVDFLCNQWLDAAEDDGMIIRVLQPSTWEDITDFKYLFFVTMRRNLYDGHIWLSLFTRPAQSSFTTCQRLATCMSLLMTSMIANAIFYKADNSPPGTTITIGPFTFSVSEIQVAFTVALIVIPFNFLIILLFKRAGPKIAEPSTKYELNEAERIYRGSQTYQEFYIKNYDHKLKFLWSLLFPGGNDEDSDIKKPLPHWLIYIAYLLAFASSVTSAFFVISYGFQFGKTKSDKFVASMLFSFCYSVFLIQPLKVVILSVIFSVFLKVPSSAGRASYFPHRDLKPLSEEEEEIEMTKIVNKDSNRFKLPEERRLNEFRMARMKEKRINIIVKEVLVHLSFVVLVIVVAYSSADPSCFDLYNSVHQLCASNGILKDYINGKIKVDGEDVKIPSGYDVATNEDWFTWTANSVVGYLFPEGWYNEKSIDFPHGFVADSASSKVLAMARFRQLRVMRNSCTKHPVFKYLISECNAGYSYSSEEVEEYKAGWQPPLNQTERFRRRRGKRKALWKGLEDPWLYQTTSQLKNPFPFTGVFNTYTGSSYAVSIGPDRRTAKKIINELRKNFWVDRYTRALFTEINIYNANTNLLLIVTFLHEVLPTGGWNFYTNVQALRLYRYVGGLGDLVIVFDIVFSAISFIGVFKSVRAIRKSSLKEYLSNPWNLLHVVVTVNSICAIAFTLGRMLAVNAAVAEYTAEPEMFVSFQFVGQLEYLIIGCLGFVLFFTNLEFLRILRFNRLIALLSKSISIMSGPLLSFGLIFFVLFMAFVSFTTCIYVDKLEDFQSVPRSFVTMTTMFLGKISVSDYFNNAPVFGPLMFASYMLSIQMIMINLFVGLICDAFAEVSEHEAPDEEPSVFSFMINRVKNINRRESIMDPIYCEWKSDWEQNLEVLSDGCDNCTYLMRNIEVEELRQNKFFDQEDEIKIRMLVAVIGLDFFTSEVEFCDGLMSLEKKLLNMTTEDSKRFLKQAAIKRRIALQQELLESDED